MALKLDNTLLDELGLGALPEQEKQLLLRQIYERLEMNVGMRLANQMSNEQLDEFERFVDSNDDKGAFQWLESNFPNYKQVVNEEFEKLKAEIRQFAPQMLAVASQATAGVQPGQPMPGQGMPGQHPGMGQPGGQYAAQPGYQQGQPAYAQPSPDMGQQGPQPGYGQYQQPGYVQPGPAQYQQTQPQYGAQPGQYAQPQYGQPAGGPGQYGHPGQYSGQHGNPANPHHQQPTYGQQAGDASQPGAQRPGQDQGRPADQGQSSQPADSQGQ